MFKFGRKQQPALRLASAQITKVDGDNRITFTLDGQVHEGVTYLFGYSPVVFEKIQVLVRPDGSMLVLGAVYETPAATA